MNLVKKLFILSHFVFILYASHAERLSLKFIPHESKLKQGSFVKGDLIIEKQSENQTKTNLSFLKGKKISDLMLIHDLQLQADDTDSWKGIVLFLNPLKLSNHTLVYKDDENDVTLTLNQVEVLPTSHSQKLEFLSFEIDSKKNFSWIIVFYLLGAGVILSSLYPLFKRWKKKKDDLKQRREELEKVGQIKTYEEVVSFFLKKDSFLENFPQFQDSFKIFETTLNKVQFKKQQSDEEKSEVMKAFKKFQDDLLGPRNGI